MIEIDSNFEPREIFEEYFKHVGLSLSFHGRQFLFNFPLYLQSVPVHSAKVVKSCTEACRRVPTSTLIYLIGSESSCDLVSETYKLELKNYNYNYNNYILNLVERSIGKLVTCFVNLLKNQ
jgi:hypothetical protein